MIQILEDYDMNYTVGLFIVRILAQLMFLKLKPCVTFSYQIFEARSHFLIDNIVDGLIKLTFVPTKQDLGTCVVILYLNLWVFF